VDINTARLIRAIKISSTYRYLSEKYYSKDDPEYGCQWAGVDLCRDACNALGIEAVGCISCNVQEETLEKLKLENPDFDLDNLSEFGCKRNEKNTFYWWE
jgi:hypothetical protein